MLYVFATLLPLAAFVVEILAGKRLGKATAYLATAAIGTAFLLSGVGLARYVMFDRTRALEDNSHHASHETGKQAGAHDAHGNNDDNAPSRSKNPVSESGSIAWATLDHFSKQAPSGAVQLPMAIRIGYRIDNLTALMFFMVTLVATCVHLYAMGYMAHEVRFSRFFSYLSLFCFSMLALVVADNLFQIFICWELVGVSSYLLIGFYYEKRSASNAANKAFITNRVGDVGFIIGLMVIFANLGTFDIDTLYSMVRTADGTLKTGAALPMSHFWLTVAGIGIFVGCVGKSAQFPLQVWLPDAMEGPTPVSALIHAATMVAAGVYLTARAFPLFTHEARLVIAYVGGITLFMSATKAIVATDIKKALAFSTVSQLGFMMFAIAIGGWVAGLMHLVTHAFFKALMFLCSGSVIHGTGTQEMPQMGGLHKKMPITSITMLIGVLAIAGFPLTSGFYSKDAIIAQTLAFLEVYPKHSLLLALPIVTAGITAFYMFRLWLMTFTGLPRDKHAYDHAHESPPIMWVPLAILAFFAIFSAGIPGVPVLERLIAFGEPAAAHTGQLAPVQSLVHGLHGTATLVASLAAGIGIAMAFAVYYFRMLNPADAKRQFSSIYELLKNRWYFDEIYSCLFVRPTMVLSGWIVWIDRTIIDWFLNTSARATVSVSKLDGKFDLGIVDGLVNLVGNTFFRGGVSLKRVQSGWLRGYVAYIAAGVVGLFLVGAFFFG